MGKEDANKPMNIVNDNMSDTPETDAQGWGNGLHPWVATDFARKLERERDEAITRRMETIMQCELYEQERDEAREKAERYRLEANSLMLQQDEAMEQFKELIYIADRAIDLAEIDFENDKFGVVSELRDGLEKIKEKTK
jgi:inorganic triphosphatase YgiF